MKVRRLGDCALLFEDGDWVESKDQDPNGQVRLVQLADIGVAKFLDKSNRFLTREKAQKLRCTFLKRGDILIARMPDPIGRACLFPGASRECVTVVDAAILRPKEDCDPDYIQYWINSPNIQRAIRETAKGATRQRVARRALEDLPITLPSLDEQRRIVTRIKECMDRIDEIALLRGTSALESKVLHRSFYHEQYERLISNGKTVRLEQAAKFMGGGTPSKQNPSFWMGTIPWISPKDMKRRDLYDATDHISDAAISGSSTKLISEPSVLFVVRGMILAHTLPIAVNRVPVAINQDMKAAVPTNGFDVDFLAAMLRGAEKKLLSQVEIAGHGTCRLQQPHWTGVPIPVLSQSEQADVVAATQAFESIADRLRTEVTSNESEAMRAAVLRKAFAGEL